MGRPPPVWGDRFGWILGVYTDFCWPFVFKKNLERKSLRVQDLKCLEETNMLIEGKVATKSNFQRMFADSGPK